jgi:hypothetical protein
MSLLERFYLQVAQEALMVFLYLAGLIICVRNRGMSRWMSLVVAGFVVMIMAAPMVQAVGHAVQVVGLVVRRFKHFEEFTRIMRVVEILQSLSKIVGMGLIVSGLGLVFIDLGRRFGPFMNHRRESDDLNRPALSLIKVGKS